MSQGNTHNIVTGSGLEEQVQFPAEEEIYLCSHVQSIYGDQWISYPLGTGECETDHPPTPNDKIKNS
jgi:hypothetical protein